MRRPEPDTTPKNTDLRNEVRIVCAGYGQFGHQEHVWTKARPSLAKKFIEKKTTEMTGTRFAAMELPYRLQVRAVTDWEDFEWVEPEVEVVEVADGG
jgi:hypothetical protein